MRQVSHLTLFTHNVAAMTDFYRVMMGVDPVYSDDHITIFKSGQVSLLIHAILEEAESGLPFEDHFSFHVPDADEAHASLLAEGIVFERDPQTYSWGRSAYLRDPDGRLVEIHEKDDRS